MQARAPAVRSEFGTVFREHFSYVWNSLRHFGVHASDLEDLTHEVFLRVHERFDECDQSRPLRPWLFAFAYRVAAAHRRLARHRVEVIGAGVDPVADAPPADELLVRREERQVALQILEDIELDRRAVFILHEIDGFPIPEVAGALRIPVATAYSRLRLARRDCAAAVRRLRLARGVR
ncbi:MAG TPA: RNA polymerase sigma factor [Polyangiaceae bacterium]|nr:RNA polymerase sigma factor [Polyangiaceae bacterium]